jgi:hypothetical protein
MSLLPTSSLDALRMFLNPFSSSSHDLAIVMRTEFTSWGCRYLVGSNPDYV